MNKIGTDGHVITMIKQRKFDRVDHVSRMEETKNSVHRKNTPSKPWKRWIDDIKEWTDAKSEKVSSDKLLVPDD